MEGKFKTEFASVTMKMEIQRVDEEVCMLEFTKTDGALMDFYDKVKMIKNDFIKPLTEVYQKSKQEKEE